MKKLAFAFLLACTAGCDGGGGGDVPGRIAEPPFIATSDVEYIDSVVPKHWMAIRMTDEVLERGKNNEVRDLALKIQARLLQEVHWMESIRLQIANSPETPQVVDPHWQDDVERLESLSGGALDHAWLEEMIANHSVTIDLSHRALPALFHSDLEAIARDVFLEGARDVGAMAELLDAPLDGP